MDHVIKLLVHHEGQVQLRALAEMPPDQRARSVALARIEAVRLSLLNSPQGAPGTLGFDQPR